jgi:hypothetical protein
MPPNLKKIGSMKLGFVIAFVFFCFQLLAQKPYVELIISPENVELNETFTVTVKSNIQGDINIDLPESFMNGNNVMNRMEHEVDQITGEVITFIYYSRSGTMRKTGKFSCGPAFVRRGNKVYRSNLAQIQVNEIGSMKEESTDHNILRKPACGLIVPSKTEVFIGEALCLEAKVISKFSPTHYESYESYKLQPITETHDLGKNQQATVRLEGIGKYQRFVFEHDKKVIFPQAEGKLIIEPFELILQSGFDSYPVTSKRTSVKVKSLPAGAPKSFNGAVGSYTIAAKIKKWSGKEGEIIPFEIKLEGTGNIHDVVIPFPKLPKGFTFYGDPEVKEHFNFSENGANGTIHYTFHLLPNQVGVFKSPVIQFSYFDLSTKNYITIQTKSEEWIVLSDPNNQINGENKRSPLLVEVYNDPENSDANSGTSTWMKLLGYSSTAILACLLIIGFSKKKRSSKKEQDSASEEVLNIKKEYSVSNLLNRLQIYLDNQNKEKFYSESKKGIIEFQNWKVSGDPNISFSDEELSTQIENGKISNEAVASLKSLERSADNYLYGGIEGDGEGLAFLNKLRVALKH